MITDTIIAELLEEGQPKPEDAKAMTRFFQVGPGGYGEGDQFLGVKIPPLRRVAKKHRDMSLDELVMLLQSPIHEVRALAAIIMADQAAVADDMRHKQILDVYLSQTARLNNWDIIDSSCRDVVGGYILQHPEAAKMLPKLAVSDSLWERRIAMVSTWPLIRAGKLDDCFAIATILLGDHESLIHKAVGWMLREAGDKDMPRMQAFLTTHIAVMPRTALRYAVEHMTPDDRAHFMKLK